MSEYFSIDDADGNEITTGVAPSEVLGMAQQIANRRNEAVHYYSSKDPDDCGDVYPEPDPNAEDPAIARADYLNDVAKDAAR